MDTQALRLFVIAADLLNISAAARQLGLAPSVASARLAKLEKEIGADLLHRSTRKVSLSEEGKELLPYAREILSQEEAAIAALGYNSDEISGTLRFAASSTFAQQFIAPILPEFLERHPKLNLQLSLSDTRENLIEGGFDLALRNSAIEDSNLKARKLANDRRILCASPNYLKKYGTPETPRDLIAHHLLSYMGKPARKLLPNDETLPPCTFPPHGVKSRIIANDGASMKIATIAGAGISMNSIWSIIRS